MPSFPLTNPEATMTARKSQGCGRLCHGPIIWYGSTDTPTASFHTTPTSALTDNKYIWASAWPFCLFSACHKLFLLRLSYITTTWGKGVSAKSFTLNACKSQGTQLNRLVPPSEYGFLHTTPVMRIIIGKPAIHISEFNFGSPEHVTDVQRSNASHNNQGCNESYQDFRNSQNYKRQQKQYGTWQIIFEIPHTSPSFLLTSKFIEYLSI